MVTRRGLLRTFGTLLLASVATGAYAVAYEPVFRLRTATYRITPPNWPEGLRLRLVLLADLQACEPWMPAWRIRSICGEANRLGGDMILLLGDFVSGMTLSLGTVAPEVWAGELAKLSAPLGVHAIMGNHDWGDDPEAMAKMEGPTISHRALASVGIPVYDNRAERFEKEGQAFWLAGLADQLEPRRGQDDLPGTLAQVTDDAPVILMAHEPDIFPRVPPRIAVTLSGHTHGGQIRLFDYSPMVPSQFGNRYAYGHVVEDARNLVVSGGLGCSIMPVRLGSPPEITVVDLG